MKMANKIMLIAFMIIGFFIGNVFGNCCDCQNIKSNPIKGNALCPNIQLQMNCNAADGSTTNRYVFLDAKGSIIKLIDSTGKVITKCPYCTHDFSRHNCKADDEGQPSCLYIQDVSVKSPADCKSVVPVAKCQQ